MSHILIIENETLLGAALQSYLLERNDLQISGISPVDQAGLIEEIERLQPDIVLVNEDTQLVDPAQLLALFNTSTRLRVVVISADSNLVRIYDRQDVSLVMAADIFDILGGRPGQAH